MTRGHAPDPHQRVLAGSIPASDGKLDHERTMLDRIARGEKIPALETVRRHKDGTLIDVSIRISPVIELTTTLEEILLQKA